MWYNPVLVDNDIATLIISRDRVCLWGYRYYVLDIIVELVYRGGRVTLQMMKD